MSPSTLGSPVRDSLRIVTVPRQDRSLADAAGRVVAALPDDLSPDDALAWFRDELRRTLPDASVRPQDDLARSDGGPIVWYVTNRPRPFRIDAAVTVPLAPDAAFAVYTERVAEWQTAVALAPLDDAAPLVGREYGATYEFLGRRYTGRMRVLHADPPRTVSIDAGGSGFSVWYITRFDATEDGTRVAIRGDYELPSSLLERIADRLGLERAIARDIDGANETYRLLCERIANGEDG